MREIVTQYNDLVSFLASFFAITGVLLGLVIYLINKRKRAEQAKHRFQVEHRSFEINNLQSIITLGWHQNGDSISINSLISIYKNEEQFLKLKQDSPGTYNQLYEVITLHEESKVWSLTNISILVAIILIFVCTLIATIMYRP